MLRILFDKIAKNWKEIIIIVITLSISGFVHGLNMFGFPYYENDEGTYLSQAWSVITIGKLAPYTYWYDHAPAGWIFVSLWLLFTKSLFLFGTSINSGRVFMLLIHIISTLFVIRISKKLTGNLLAGIIAGLIFSLSPLGLYFQRRLLLDNIMIFWVLLAYDLILGSYRKLSNFILSGVIMGIAVLTKENAIFFIPGFLYTIFKNVHPHNKRFSISTWLIVFFSVVSIYFLFALLKGEFFPYGTLLGGSSEHVSLIGTLKYQTGREGGSVLQLMESSFWKNFLLWVKQDSFLIYSGIISNLILIVISILRRKSDYVGILILTLFFWVFLMRGGTVIEFYVVPLIPLLGLLIGVTLFEISEIFGKLFKTKLTNVSLLFFTIIIFIFYFNYSQVSRAFGQNNTGHATFLSRQTDGQIEAIDWIRNHIATDSIIIIDNYSYLDLQSNKNLSNIIYPNAHYYWKVDLDNEIKNDLLKNDPESIDFIAKTPQMTGDLIGNISPLTSNALSNSVLVKGFNSDGWGVEIWAVRYPSKILDRSWETYKKVFLKDEENSIDPNQQNITTSEGQSYAMLRAVWTGDKEAFSKVWKWTSKNLTNSEGVFAWKWGVDSVTGQEKILDNGSASDADTDIALALLFAYKKWGDESYLKSAKDLLNSIWNVEVKNFKGKNYIIPGNWAMNNDNLIVNPSYLSPYAYRIFAEADPSHTWIDLVDSSYEVLHGCSTDPLFEGDKPVNLPPNWCQLGKDGKFSMVAQDGLQSTDYSYDAIRTMWRLALDYKWYAEPRARNLLNLSGSFLLTKFKDEGKIIVGYTHDGKSWEKYESVLGYATSLANFSITSRADADIIYREKILSKFYEDFENNNSYWEDPKNYYVQNWAWFGTALYANELPNLWKK